MVASIEKKPMGQKRVRSGKKTIGVKRAIGTKESMT